MVSISFHIFTVIIVCSLNLLYLFAESKSIICDLHLLELNRELCKSVWQAIF